MVPWHQDLLYAFPPIPALHRVLTKIWTDCATVILIAPSWPRQPWFSFLTRMLLRPLISLPLTANLLSQKHGRFLHPNHVSSQSLVPIWFSQNELACSEQVQRVLLHRWCKQIVFCYLWKWKRFTQWCSTKQLPPTSAPLLLILDYLLDLKQSGLSFSSIKVHLATITTFHDKIDDTSVFAHPVTKRFLKGCQSLSQTDLLPLCGTFT